MAEEREIDIEKMNNFIASDDFNPADYELAEEEKEMSNFLGMLQVFNVYFKELFKRNPKNSIFEGVDYDRLDSTNRVQELFYEHLWRYKQVHLVDIEAITIYPITEFNINDCKELYSLKIGDEEYGCQYLIPLLSFLTQHNWMEIEWSLLPIKRED